MSCRAQDFILESTADPKQQIRQLRRQEATDSSAAMQIALGVAYYRAGQHILFRRKMQHAMARDPDAFAPHYLLGRHYDSDVEDFPRAIGHFRDAIRRSPKHAHSHAFLGHALEMSDSREEAAAAYRRAIELDRCESTAMAGLGRLELANAGEMIRTLRCGIDDPAILRVLAKRLVSDNRPREAVPYLERAMAADPRNPALAYQLHRLWRALGDEAQSTAAMENYRRLRAIYGGQ